MCNEEKSCIKRVISICSKILLVAGVVVAFYKLPTVIAEKISYRQLKNKKIKQNYGED